MMPDSEVPGLMATISGNNFRDMPCRHRDRWLGPWFRAAHGRWARRYLNKIGQKMWAVGPSWRRS